MDKNLFKSAIKNLLIKANTVFDRNVYEKLQNYKNQDKKKLILENCRLVKEAGRPLCQDTGQVLVFLKLPFDFNFGFDFKKAINETVEETYKEKFYRKSVVKDSIFDRKNTSTNTPAIIYTDFEDRTSVQIDVLIKGGGAENMSFVEMFNPTSTQEELVSKLSQKIIENGINACPPLFIGIGAGGTMDYAAILSKKALFEGTENEFCEKIKEKCNNSSSDFGSLTVLSVKIKTSSTHIASLPVAVTINCHSNRHSGCEIGINGIIYNDDNYDMEKVCLDFSDYKKVRTMDEIKNLNPGEKILLSGTVYTMRDAAHKRISESIELGEELPFEIKNSIIFYAGPAPKKEGEIIGPVGPTTSKRMDKYAPKLYDLGCIATIGKGIRSEEVIESCKRNKAKYFVAQGGVACLLQKCFIKSEIIAYEDLGAEAIYKFEVKDLPLIVKI